MSEGQTSSYYAGYLYPAFTLAGIEVLMLRQIPLKFGIHAPGSLCWLEKGSILFCCVFLFVLMKGIKTLIQKNNTELLLSL